MTGRKDDIQREEKNGYSMIAAAICTSGGNIPVAPSCFCAPLLRSLLTFGKASLRIMHNAHII